jgi:hypothetical protein
MYLSFDHPLYDLDQLAPVLGGSERLRVLESVVPVNLSVKMRIWAAADVVTTCPGSLPFFACVQ